MASLLLKTSPGVKYTSVRCSMVGGEWGGERGEGGEQGDPNVKVSELMRKFVGGEME